jgi:hypothetical protein
MIVQGHRMRFKTIDLLSDAAGFERRLREVPHTANLNERA